MNKFLLRTLPYAVVGLLSACSPTQDGGTNNNISGLAVDGYLAGSKVYLDINGDARLNPYEPWAITDTEGRFSTASDGSNYCASATTQQHCLSVGEYSGYDMRIEGGYDTLTGEAFQGVISRTLDSTSNQIASPLSSLQSVMSASQISAWLVAENLAATTSLTTADLSTDPLSITTATSANQTHLIQTAWLLHKSVAIMAAELKRIYPNSVPGNEALATDYAPYVYQALVTTWSADTTQAMQALLGTPAKVDAIMVEANTLLLADGATADVYAPQVMSGRIADLISLIDTNLFTTTGYTQAEVYARGRAIEVLTIMLSSTTPANIATTITDLSLAGTLTNLEHTATNVGQIAADYTASGVAVTNYSGRSLLATALPADVATNPLAVNDGAGGTADVLIDTTAGTVSIDMLVDVDNDGTPDPVVIPGTIEAINDYTSVITLDIAGSQQTIILETGPSGELIFDTSALEGLDMADLTN